MTEFHPRTERFTFEKEQRERDGSKKRTEHRNVYFDPVNEQYSICCGIETHTNYPDNEEYGYGVLLVIRFAKSETSEVKKAMEVLKRRGATKVVALGELQLTRTSWDSSSYCNGEYNHDSDEQPTEKFPVNYGLSTENFKTLYQPSNKHDLMRQRAQEEFFSKN